MLEGASEKGSVTWAAKRTVETGSFLPLLLEAVTRSSRNERILNHYCSKRDVGAVVK